jgi:hypothetical protein
MVPTAPDVTIQEMYPFSVTIVQIEHNQKDILKAYWSTGECFSTPFYGNAIKKGIVYHLLRFLHFNDNKNRSDKDR